MSYANHDLDVSRNRRRANGTRSPVPRIVSMDAIAGARLSTPTTRGKPVSKVTQLKRSRTASELDTPTDLDGKAVAEISKALNGILADSFRALSQDQEFPLARQRPALPQLPPAVRGTGRGDLRDHRRDRRARPQDRRHHAALDRPHRQGAVDQGQRRGVRHRRRHGPRADERQQGGRGRDAQGAQARATTTRTSRPRACSRSTSTRPRSGPGSCSNPHARRTSPGTDAFPVRCAR